jgi:calcium/proton exchanger cax
VRPAHLKTPSNMSNSRSDATRTWPYATIPTSKPHVEPLFIGLQRQNETRWVECRELPSVHSHDLESQNGASRLSSRLSQGQVDIDNGTIVHGESGRRWLNPLLFLVICWRSSSRTSMLTNSLWPFTIAAMILHYCDNDNQLWIFVSAYVGMVPAANLVGFAGHQLARKLPTTFGVLVETAIGSCVELVLLIVLIQQEGNMCIRVIRAVILGSILANLLLCLGLCFFVGGIFYPNQAFHVAISEVACNLMLVAGMGLVIPSIFFNSLKLSSEHSTEFLEERALRLSRVVAVVLLSAFLAYLWFQTRSHFGIYQDILQADETRHGRQSDKPVARLTLTEALLAVAIGVTFVSFMAVFLVQQIEVSSHNPRHKCRTKLTASPVHRHRPQPQRRVQRPDPSANRRESLRTPDSNAQSPPKPDELRTRPSPRFLDPDSATQHPSDNPGRLGSR